MPQTRINTGVLDGKAKTFKKNQKNLKKLLTTCPIGDIIIKSPRARATKTAHSGNEIKQINNGF